MTHPTTRDGVLEASETEFAALLEFVDQLSPEQRERDFASPDRDRNVRDVLAHLHAWHLLLMQWQAEGASGGTPEIPAPGYTWATLDELNESLRDRYSATSLADIRELLIASHNASNELISEHSQEELFFEGALPWTGTSTLAEFAIECTSAHYDWALAKLRRLL